MTSDSSASIQSSIDHLVVAASTLPVGVKWIEELFGVKMSPGGMHPRMGTHNALLKIGDKQYLEVIAIDPNQPSPHRERWFGLDHMDSSTQPAFITWVARTSSIQTAARALRWNPSCIETMSRGSLEWSITIPNFDDWKAQSCLPMLIQWGDERHPIDHLPDASVRLIGLELHSSDAAHTQEQLRELQFSPGTSFVVTESVHQRILAEFDTPNGRVILSSQ